MGTSMTQGHLFMRRGTGGRVTKRHCSGTAHSMAARSLSGLICLLVLCAPNVLAQTNDAGEPAATNAISKFRSPEDGWLDASGFLEGRAGFLPVPLIITDPAVGYGGGALSLAIVKPRTCARP